MLLDIARWFNVFYQLRNLLQLSHRLNMRHDAAPECG
jgi:hypothetical protein